MLATVSIYVCVHTCIYDDHSDRFGLKCHALATIDRVIFRNGSVLIVSFEAYNLIVHAISQLKIAFCNPLKSIS